MANSLNIDLHGKIVLIKVGMMQAGYTDEMKRAFLVESGFGASATTNGTAIIGNFLCDNERAKMDGYNVERLAPSHIIDYYINFKRTLNNLKDE